MIAKNLYFEYKKRKRVLENINLEVSPGMNIIIGPNASGKSTILKCLAGILKTKNSVFFEGKEINKCRDLYRVLSYLPQQIYTNAALSVFEIMLLGKIEQLSWRVSKQNLNLIEETLKEFGIENIAPKKIGEISGGQQQEVFVAQSLMKKPKYLLIDEPTNNLDLKNQFEIMEKISEFTKKNEARTLIVLHDLNLAIRYADNLYLVKNGTILAQGSPNSIISEEMIKNIYGIEAEIVKNKEGLYIIPKARNSTKF